MFTYNFNGQSFQSALSSRKSLALSFCSATSLSPLAASFFLFFSTMFAVHATPIRIGGDDGGNGGNGGSFNQPAVTPGPAYPWEGHIGTTKTGNGNQMTAINLISLTNLGGLPIKDFLD